MNHTDTLSQQVSFRDLNMDVILNIISWLDNRSIVNLLKAVPELKNEAVLITDHDSMPMLFDIEGIERLRIGEFDEDLASSELPAYSSYRRCRPIRLVEFQDIYCAMECLGLQKGKHQLKVTNTTFIFLFSGSRSIILKIDEAMHRLESMTHCKWSMGAPVCIPSQGRFRYPGTSSRVEKLMDGKTKFYRDVQDVMRHPSHNRYASLTGLSIETSNELTGLYLPALRELLVLFNTSDDILPEFSNIVAPFVSIFTLHYTNRFPLVKKVNLGTLILERGFQVSLDPGNNIMNAEVPTHESGLLEIARTDHLQRNKGHMSGIHTPSVKHLGDYDDTDMSFTSYFRSVHLIGVPECIARKCDFTTVEQLRWIITEPPVFPEDMDESRTVNLGSTIKLLISLEREGCRFPKFSRRMFGSSEFFWRTFTSHLRVFVMAENVNLDNLWGVMPQGRRNTLQDCLIAFTLYRDPALMELNAIHGGPREGVSLEVLEHIFNAHPSIFDLDLIGIEMPFLNHQRWNLSSHRHIRESDRYSVPLMPNSNAPAIISFDVESALEALFWHPSAYIRPPERIMDIL